MPLPPLLRLSLVQPPERADERAWRSRRPQTSRPASRIAPGEIVLRTVRNNCRQNRLFASTKSENLLVEAKKSTWIAAAASSARFFEIRSTASWGNQLGPMPFNASARDVSGHAQKVSGRRSSSLPRSLPKGFCFRQGHGLRACMGASVIVSGINYVTLARQALKKIERTQK